MGFLECCRDRRVKSVIAMAGNLSNISNPVQHDNGVPIMHILGDADELAPYGASIAYDREQLDAEVVGHVGERRARAALPESVVAASGLFRVEH